MMLFLKEKLMKKCIIGLVGGSDLVKIREQMGGDSFSKNKSIIKYKIFKKPHEKDHN